METGIAKFDHGPIRELRLNRPPVNALSPELIISLRLAIQNAPGDGMQALVLSGSAGCFSGGLDVPLLMSQSHSNIESFWRDFYGLLETIALSPLPIAAAMTGHAPAGGTVLALFCDWRVMAQGDFKLGLNEVQVGIPLPPIIMAGLRRVVGRRQAESMAVSGLLLTCEQALSVGLVDELVPPEHVVGRALRWCQGILALPPAAMAATRRQARADLHALFERDLEFEKRSAISSWWSPETQNTLSALVQRLRRNPAAKGSGSGK